MNVKCPFCKERVVFSRDGVCSACDEKLNSKQMIALEKALTKRSTPPKRTSQLIACWVCGAENDLADGRCQECDEPLEEVPLTPRQMKGIWRKGKILVMALDARLPDICIMTNKPAHGFSEKKTLTAIPFWAKLMSYFKHLFKKKVTIEYGLYEKWEDDNMVVRFLSFIATVFCLIVLIYSSYVLYTATEAGEDGSPAYWIVFLISTLSFLYFLYKTKKSSVNIEATKITKEYVFIKGINIDFVRRFPKWDR